MENILTALSRVKRMGLKMIFKVYDLAMDSDKYIRYSHFTTADFTIRIINLRRIKLLSVHIPKTGGTSLK